jgi:hypothetical protein
MKKKNIWLIVCVIIVLSVIMASLKGCGPSKEGKPEPKQETGKSDKTTIEARVEQLEKEFKETKALQSVQTAKTAVPSPPGLNQEEQNRILLEEKLRNEKEAREEKITELNDDIKEIEADIKFVQEDLSICKKAAKTAPLKAVFTQAERDRKKDEETLSKLKESLQKNTTELKKLLAKK